MPLNVGTGNFKPYCKYNSKSDKWLTAGDEEISHPTFIADLANIATGWFRFREGQAPERRIDPSLDRAAPNPGEDFKRGFVLSIYSQQFFAGAVEFCSASVHVGNAVRELYAAWEAERDAHPGELPVVTCTGSEPMRDKYGTNYRPKFQIVKWAPRPAELPDESPVDPVDVWNGDLLTPIAKPRPQPRPAVAEALRTEF